VPPLPRAALAALALSLCARAAAQEAEPPHRVALELGPSAVDVKDELYSLRRYGAGGGEVALAYRCLGGEIRHDATIAWAGSGGTIGSSRVEAEYLWRPRLATLGDGRITPRLGGGVAAAANVRWPGPEQAGRETTAEVVAALELSPLLELRAGPRWTFEAGGAVSVAMLVLDQGYADRGATLTHAVSWPGSFRVRGLLRARWRAAERLWLTATWALELDRLEATRRVQAGADVLLLGLELGWGGGP
jgi:hypothetical protein